MHAMEKLHLYLFSRYCKLTSYLLICKQAVQIAFVALVIESYILKVVFFRKFL